MSIPFNKPHLTGKECEYIHQAVLSGKISGDGRFTKRCHEYFETKYGFKKCLLTTSCTDALEMAAILIDIKPGDEVIVPSYTFVSTANAFVLRGAKVIFADSQSSNPNIDVNLLEALITPKTRAIVPVHYSGIACDMDAIMQLAEKYNLFVVEDAAQAIDSFFTGADGTQKALGSIGHLAAFSFHETKNVISGEGGMLVINDPRFLERAEIIREKGTNRTKFFRGEVDKYGWVDVGSSYLPSDIIAAFLYAQLENIEDIQKRRMAIWNQYHELLSSVAEDAQIQLPHFERFSTNNAHMFYLVCKDATQRRELIESCKKKQFHPVFHYLSLHKSKFFEGKHDGRELPNSDRYSDCLVRLPFFYELADSSISEIADTIKQFLLQPVSR